MMEAPVAEGKYPHPAGNPENEYGIAGVTGGYGEEAGVTELRSKHTDNKKVSLHTKVRRGKKIKDSLKVLNIKPAGY